MSSFPQSPPSDLGPFHGDNEGLATYYVWITWVEAAALLFGPWILVSLTATRARGHFSFLKLGILDFLGMLLFASYLGLWRRLSAKVAKGGTEAKFLDRMRFEVAKLVQGLVLLLLMAVIFLVTSSKR